MQAFFGENGLKLSRKAGISPSLLCQKKSDSPAGRPNSVQIEAAKALRPIMRRVRVEDGEPKRGILIGENLLFGDE